MMDDADEPVVLLRSQLWPWVAVPAGALGASAVLAFWLGWSSMPGMMVIALFSLVAAIVLRSDALLADSAGLLVRRRGRVQRSYRWEEIVEAGLTPRGYGLTGLAVFPQGGPYDVPGPNASVIVGTVWGGRDRQAVARVEAALQAHGVRPLPASPPARPGRPDTECPGESRRPA